VGAAVCSLNKHLLPHTSLCVFDGSKAPATVCRLSCMSGKLISLVSLLCLLGLRGAFARQSMTCRASLFCVCAVTGSV
jgi:hypothetical protein